jgi:hypothetical protein
VQKKKGGACRGAGAYAAPRIQLPGINLLLFYFYLFLLPGVHILKRSLYSGFI